MEKTQSLIVDYLAELRSHLEMVPVEQLATVATCILDAYRQGRLVVIAGNGGSAATASHLAADLSKNIFGPGVGASVPRLKVMALTDNVPLITAWANDASYGAVFAEQLRPWIGPGDLLIVMSVSGSSPNVVEAVRLARQRGAHCIGFLGKDGGQVKDLLDLAIVVPGQHYGRAEDMHMMFSHIVTASVQDAIAAEFERAQAGHVRPEAEMPRALVLAAGEGTRLRPLTTHNPKVMLPVGGKPLLEATVEWLRGHGITEIAVNLHHRPEAIVNHFGDGARWGVHLQYSFENSILGTAGAVRKLGDFLGDGRPFVVVYGDVLTDLDLHALLAQHKEVRRRDPSAMITMSLCHAANPTEVGLVQLDPAGRIIRFVEKPAPGEVFSDLASAGVLIAEPGIIDRIPSDTFYDLGLDLFPRLLESGVPLYGWVIPESAYLLDIGTPERYARAQVEWPARRPLGLAEARAVAAEL